jgi:peptide/nickel transport system permease protein
MAIWLQNILILAGALTFLGAIWMLVRAERWERAWARFRRDRSGWIAVVILGLYGLVALIDSIQLTKNAAGESRSVLDFCFKGVAKEKSYSAPLATKSHSVNRAEILKGQHLMGTDVFGRDVLHQTMKACRTALILGGLTSLIYIPLGTLLGIAAGYYKKKVDDAVQYIYSTLSSIPEILLLIAMLMVLGRGLLQMSIALGITNWVGLCRLMRGETMRQVERPYTEAAKALGQTNGKIILRHILPNTMHLVIINFILGFSGIVLSEAMLSYLGVGAPIGTPSWGIMINAARMELAREPSVWWNLGAASLALFFLVLSLNLLGESLRRAFDPRTR